MNRTKYKTRTETRHIDAQDVLINLHLQEVSVDFEFCQWQEIRRNECIRNQVVTKL